MINVVLAGTSGYGGIYLKFLLEEPKDYQFKLTGVVDPYVEKSPYYKKLSDMDIPMYNNMKDFYKNHTSDLAVISSPIQFHAVQTEIALANNSNVLCEKPVCAGPDDIKKMESFKDKYDNFVEIGYQWSHAKPILQLKEDILSGKLGKAEYFKTMVLWPRGNRYFKRNNWAGKIKSKDGSYILDSVANNATAHYLHNMFFLSGASMESSNLPKIEECVLGRANDIENFDTITYRGLTKSNALIYFAASHPVLKTTGPVFEFKFENATVTYHAQQQKDIIAKFNDGTLKNYGDPSLNDDNKLWMCMDKILNDKYQLPCNVDTALSHARCINDIHKNYKISNFKRDLIKNVNNKAPVTIVKGLDDELKQCYENMSMMSLKYLNR